MLQTLIFIAVVLTVYGSVNFYLYRRTIRAAALNRPGRRTLKVLLTLLILAYPAGLALGGENLTGLLLLWVGSLWIGVMFYGFLFALLFDLLRASDLLLGWLPSWLLIETRQARRMALALTVLTIILVLISGRVRAMYPVVRTVTIEINPMPPERDEYTIALFSDPHFGSLVGPKQAQTIINLVNDYAPDLCLIPGDVLEDRVEHLGWLTEYLQKLEATDGVYAVPGNHESYLGLEETTVFLTAAGITVLIDQVQQVGEALNLIGLSDQSSNQQFDRTSPPIDSLAINLDRSRPLVVMHHTPTRIAEAQQAGVQLMLSGHTHGGQLWPTRLITTLIYGVKQGLTTFDGMAFYLSNGIGTWGPPVRVFTPPELIIITLVPKGLEQPQAPDAQAREI